jgi:tripartite-type tricarboxylate transporter receptor subunit TctC
MLRALLVVACATSVLAIGAAAQDFPSKNITLMMPYAAGGPGDTVTRIVGQGMSKAMGRTFIVEKK